MKTIAVLVNGVCTQQAVCFDSIALTFEVLASYVLRNYEKYEYVQTFVGRAGNFGLLSCSAINCRLKIIL